MKLGIALRRHTSIRSRGAPRPSILSRRYTSDEQSKPGFWSKLTNAFGISNETALTVTAEPKSLFDMGRPPTQSKQVAELCDQAAQATKANNHLLAKELLTRALMVAPAEEAWYILCRRAQASLANDDAAFALDDARKAAILMPKKKEPHLTLARVMVALDQHRKAQWFNKEALKYGAKQKELVKYDEAKAEPFDPNDQYGELITWRTGKIKLKLLDPITKISSDPEYFKHIVQGFPVEVQMIDDHTYMRGLVAAEDISQGQIIMHEDPILVATYDRNRCAHCSKPLDLKSVHRCPKCDQERHCSVECAKASLTMGHEKICGFPIRDIQTKLAQHAKDYMDASTVMMFKMVGYIRSTPNYPCDPNTIRELVHMQSLWSTKYLNKRTSTIQKNFARWEMLQKTLDLSTNRYFDYEWYERLLGKILCNALPIRKSEDEFQKNGGSTIGLYRAASFANHSCVPNAYPLHQPDKAGGRVALVATMPIKKGDQILIPYIHPQVPVEKRRQYLLKRYGFICNCPRCRVQTRMSSSTEPAPS